MDGRRVGKEIEEACRITEGWDNLRSGGNLGVAFLAEAVEKLASAIENAAILSKQANAEPKLFSVSPQPVLPLTAEQEIWWRAYELAAKENGWNAEIAARDAQIALDGFKSATQDPPT